MKKQPPMETTARPEKPATSRPQADNRPQTAMRNRRVGHDLETTGGHLLFLMAATVACIAAPLLPLQTDSAYAFFRLLQQPAFNIDDLRTLNPLTWAAMQAGVRLAAAPRTLALVFALSQVAFGYIVFLIGRYGFRYRRAGRLTLALALVSAPLWFNPANGTLNGLGWFALAYMLLEGERWSKADARQAGAALRRPQNPTSHPQAGAAGRLQTVLRGVILAALLLLCVLSDAVWLIVIAAWLLYRPLLTVGSPVAPNAQNASRPVDPQNHPACHPQASQPQTAGLPSSADATPRPRLLPRVALLALLALAALLDHLFLPQPLDFNLDFFLPVYGFRNLLTYSLQPTAYAPLFLWAGWAYLAARYICRKAYRPLAALLLLTAVFIALFGFTPGYADDFGRHFLPLWTAIALLVLQEKQPVVWLAAAGLFAVCGSADAWQTPERRQTFYRTFADNLPKTYDKYLAYNVSMPEYSFQPSALPQIELLNYTLLHTARPRVVLFPLPGVAFQSPYEADLSLPLMPGLSWPALQLNPTYFRNLFPKGNFDILSEEFFAYRPVYTLQCPAETYARDRADKPFFVCETWPDSTDGLNHGPELVELRTTERAFAGEACVKVGDRQWHKGLPVAFNVQSGDSLLVRVKRQGNGTLNTADFYFDQQLSRTIPFSVSTDRPLRRLPASTATTADGTTADQPADLWDELEIRTLIPSGVQRVIVYVAADSARTPSYFDDLEIVLSRRPF